MCAIKKETLIYYFKDINGWKRLIFTNIIEVVLSSMYLIQLIMGCN
jgi:hypothetical protein